MKLALAGALVLMAGCSMGMLQTAKTTPKDMYDVVMGVGYVHNEMVEDRGRAVSNFPPYIGVRRGMTDQLDMGVAMFMFAGLQADAKYNFLPRQSPLAVAVQGGAGIAKDVGSGATVVHVPVRAMASYDLRQYHVTPYAGVALSGYWIMGYHTDPPPDAMLASVQRKGYGDGLLNLSIGVEFAEMIVEYTYMAPVYDDSGDSFSFVDNHLFLIGRHF